MKVTIPLHLHPFDDSPAARNARAELSYVLSQINPNGFRSPGMRGTSLVEKRAVEAGMVDEPELPIRSKRGNAKRERRREANAPSEFKRTVNAMTNAERKRWAGAGYPGLAHKDMKALKPYAGAALRRLSGEYVTLAELVRRA